MIGHSQGGAIVASALRYVADGGGSLPNMRVAFHGAPLNNVLARRVVRGVGIVGRPAMRAQGADLVHHVLGLNTINPFRIAASVLMAPTLFMGPEKSQHTLPCGGPGALCVR